MSILRYFSYSVAFIICGSSYAAQNPSQCTYSTYTWNIYEKRAVNRRVISHPYVDLLPEEIDADTGCTICKEDQVWLNIQGIPKFQICRHLAGRVESALVMALSQGAKIDSIVTYRVGKTRGVADSNGNRSGFSNHSYGIGIDINSKNNGLYDNCYQFNSNCRLIRGGYWQPGQPGSLHPEGPIVQAFKMVGFKWGGEIAGKQKDFMHFSISGY